MKYDTNELARALKTIGLEAGGNVLERIAFYLTELERWNARYGFIKAAGDELVSRHLLDALAGLPLLERLLPAGDTALDVGTGAGFPGLPLAFFLTDRRFLLCERKATERSFLSNIVALLKLSHVSVIDDLARVRPGSCDAILFRAVTSLTDMYAAVRTALAANGFLFAYKGKREKIDEEIAALRPPALKAEVHTLSPPGAERERHIVIVRPV